MAFTHTLPSQTVFGGMGGANICKGKIIKIPCTFFPGNPANEESPIKMMEIHS